MLQLEGGRKRREGLRNVALAASRREDAVSQLGLVVGGLPCIGAGTVP